MVLTLSRSLELVAPLEVGSQAEGAGVQAGSLSLFTHTRPRRNLLPPREGCATKVFLAAR